MKFEDTLNRILTSIAHEEESLSKMLDVETKKMLHILDEYKHNKLSIQETKDINKCVNETIVNMIKLQMLLQHKVDSIKELLPSTTTESTTNTNSPTTKTKPKKTKSTKTKPKATSSTTLTTTHTTTSSTSTSTTTTKEKKGERSVWTYSLD
ncbi:hypothetical protein [Natranaerobius trueperi]|uniref:Uncharacterized protein n=1 Tax=Natranaerobius trueperi TaxID=759412 RepID=A0A226BXS3_9FIRM|nr:hypothetical protein [Natranaerobius trueperi]OWZ83828.1 hypothetical protein CDO51_06210 [Natranaerobius trueperi]